MRTVRIQIDLPEEAFQEVEQLMKKCGFRTKNELFDNLFSLFRWVVKQAEKGNSIASVNEDQKKYVELHMPFLDKVSVAEKQPVYQRAASSM